MLPIGVANVPTIVGAAMLIAIPDTPSNKVALLLGMLIGPDSCMFSLVLVSSRYLPCRHIYCLHRNNLRVEC